jgi:hypothetical protein
MLSQRLLFIFSHSIESSLRLGFAGLIICHLPFSFLVEDLTSAIGSGSQQCSRYY